MKFKYYHGTSSLFIDSIKEYGLGGINPNIKYRNLDLLRHLKVDAEKYLLDDNYYVNNRQSILAMSAQTELVLKNSSGPDLYFNYKHDSIYVSLTRERAVVYSCINDYGSEILQYCVNLFIKIRNKLPNYVLPDNLNLSKIENLINTEYKKVLIEIDNVDDSILATEYGQDAQKFLTSLRKEISLMNKKEKYESLQFVNFKLLEPIPLEKMKFYEIDYDSHPQYRDFEWTLTRI